MLHGLERTALFSMRLNDSWCIALQFLARRRRNPKE
jgi:plasmid maintenance system killer protein